MFGTQQGGTITTTQQRQLPPWLEPAAQQATQASQNYFQGYQSNPLTLQGLQGLGGMATNPGQIPGYGSSLQNFDDLMSGSFLYGGEGFNAALDAASNRIIPQVQGAFNQSGRLNSGLAQSELARQLGDSFASLYGQERANQMSGLSMAPQMFNYAAAPSQLAYQTGQLADNEAESNLDDFIGRLRGVGDVAGYSESMDQPFFENPLAEALGLGLTGAGLINALFGEGTVGDALGGLGGSLGDLFGLSAGESGGGGGVPPIPGSLGEVTGSVGDLGLGSDPLNAGSSIGQNLGSVLGSTFQNLGPAATAAELAGAFPGLASLVGPSGTLAGSGAAVANTLGGLGLGNAGAAATAAEIGGAFPGLAGAETGLAAGATESGLLSGLGLNPLSMGILGGAAAPFAIKALFGSDNPLIDAAKDQLYTAALEGNPITIDGQQYELDRNLPQGLGFRVKGDSSIAIVPTADGTFRVQRTQELPMTETPMGVLPVINQAPTISNAPVAVTPRVVYGADPGSGMAPPVLGPQMNPFPVGSQRWEDFEAAKYMDRRFVDQFGNPLRGGN